MAVDRDVVYDEQHARLLEGLAASIREKGLAGTQVTDIVGHARASRRTFYKHFPDKDSCFVELTNMVSRVLLEQVDRAIDREAPLATQIDQAIDTYVDILLNEPGLTATFASPGLGDRIVVAQRDAVERYARLADRAAHLGVPAAGPAGGVALLSRLFFVRRVASRSRAGRLAGPAAFSTAWACASVSSPGPTASTTGI